MMLRCSRPQRRARGRLAACLGPLLAITSTACATGEETDKPAMSTFGSEGEGEAGAESSAAEGAEGNETSGETDTTGDACGTCSEPPGDCFEPEGSCVDGGCSYPPKIAGSACGNGGLCDAMGTCVGGGECSAPHATGELQGGSCGGWVCDEGWGDCNDDIEQDGCETDLQITTAHCGSCGNDCSGPNLEASCSTGSCERVCTGDFENCDQDWSNGCEIPTGVAQRCDATGIRMDGEGCWTAYCGSNPAAAADFGTYHCVHCANCDAPSGTSCRWCDSSSGNFFPEEASCGCGSFEAAVCGP